MLLAAMLMLLAVVRAAAQPDPQDPPFELSRVLFSGAFSDHAILQRAPQSSSVFGTATIGATITVTLSGPGGYHHAATATVVTSDDPALHGTWKVLLPARPAGLGYSIEAACRGCVNGTAATLTDIGFGDTWLCSGQSNMEDPVLTTVSRNESYAAVATGKYDHIRLYQTGWRMGRKRPTWIMPQAPDDSQGYPQQSWQVPRGCADHLPGPGATCSLQRFSAMCWYFGKNLADQMAKEAELTGEAPIPIGLIHSSIGGTTIQQWMPPSTVGNATCTENNCDYVEQLAPRTPIQPRTEAKCTNASQRSVWSCPSGTCSDLWHGMIAPWVNVTISGAIWYQGTHPIGSLPPSMSPPHFRCLVWGHRLTRGRGAERGLRSRQHR
jgi:sialate O-acetylesterase